MTAVLLIFAAWATVAGFASFGAWLFCIHHGSKREAARPLAIFAVVLFVMVAMSASVALY